MVKYSAKKRTGSKKQSFKKRNYNKKKGGGGDGDENVKTPSGAVDTVDAANTVVDAPPADTKKNTPTTDGADDSENDLKKIYDDLIERILDQINNICDEKDEGKRKEMLENAIMGKTE